MDIIKIYDNSNKLYYIGGVVRDKLLGVKSFDIDVTFEGNAIEYCNKFGEVIQENPDFGTIRVLVEGKEVDFASTRSEIYPHKGHLPVVTKIGCPLKEDLLRRDFTVNALAMRVSDGEIIDYVNGQEDLKNKVLRVLHSESFIDDPTRIIRGLKFRVRFNFDLEENTRKLQEEYLKNINYDMSFKRVKKELIETFNLNSQRAFELFIKEGIYKLVSPAEFELPNTNIEKLVNNYSIDNIWLVYIGLLPDLSNIELTKPERKIIDDAKQIGELKSDFEIYKAFDNLAVESILLYGIMRDLSVAKRYLDILRNIKISITGGDLLTLGIKPSPKYQEIFDEVLKTKLQNPNMTKEDELELVKKSF
ncbi:CCA tRNA nucleotidyltransferase [bacterium]|nr:CCA tRNA nucleotidyltransferase [bacterium]